MKDHLNRYGVFYSMFAIAFFVGFVILALTKKVEQPVNDAAEYCQAYTEKLRGYVIESRQARPQKHGDGWRVLVRYFDTSNPDQITRATAECVLDKDLQLVVLRRYGRSSQSSE